MIILVNNSLITKMFWSVLSRPFIPTCHELADNKHVLRSVLSGPFRKHQMWSVVSRCVLSCDACVSVIRCVYVMVHTVMVKGRVARSRWRTGGARISSLFSRFRACMFVSSVNFRSFRVARTGVSGFCL